MVVTFWSSAFETLELKVSLPANTAVIECDPRDRLVVENFAIPPLSVAVPRTVVPSMKVTDPDGVPAKLWPARTVTVKVTLWPGVVVLEEEARVVVVESLVTFCVRDAVLPLKFV